MRLIPALDAHTVLILNSSVAKDLATLEDPTMGAKWPPQIVYRMRRDRQGLQAHDLRVLDALAHDPEWNLSHAVSKREYANSVRGGSFSR